MVLHHQRAASTGSRLGGCLTTSFAHCALKASSNVRPFGSRYMLLCSSFCLDGVSNIPTAQVNPLDRTGPLFDLFTPLFSI